MLQNKSTISYCKLELCITMLKPRELVQMELVFAPSL